VQFGFRSRHSTALQLASLVNRNFDERRLTGAVYPDVAKAFDSIWVEGLLFRLTILNFPSSMVKTISSYLHCRTFQTSFKSTKHTIRTMRAGVAQGGLVSHVLFSLYVNDMHTPSRHVDLALNAGDKTLTAISHSPWLLVGYPEIHLSIMITDYDTEGLLSTSRKAVLLAKTTICVQRPKQVHFFGELTIIETARNHGVTLDTRSDVNQTGRRTAQRCVLG
jgi:hypothetical protein